MAAGRPGWISPMSDSSTSVRTWTCDRSAIRRSTVPPVTLLVEVMAWPSSTSFSMTVPVMGALMVASSRRSRASSSRDWAL